MSDHPKEAERTMKRLYLCNDICFDLFHWLTPKKIGLELALLSLRFDALANSHFKYHRKWALGKMRIESNGVFKWNDEANKNYAVPKAPPPNGVIGFQRIVAHNQCYFDNDVLEFLRNLRPLFAKNGINLVLNVCNFTCGRSPKWGPITAAEVWPLLAESVVRLVITDDYDFSSPTHRLSANFLCQCPNLRFVDSRDIFPEVPPIGDFDVSTVSPTSAHSLWQWLHSPRADGQPKILLCQEIWPFADRMNALKTEFCNASSPVSYIIRLFLSFEGEHFELRNDRTNETLSMEMIAEEKEPNEGEAEQQEQLDEDQDDVLTHYVNPKRNLWLLKRRPIVGKGESSQTQWAQWETEAIGWDWDTAQDVIEVDNEEDVDEVN